MVATRNNLDNKWTRTIHTLSDWLAIAALGRSPLSCVDPFDCPEKGLNTL